MKNTLLLTGIASLTAMTLVLAQGPQAANESLWEAARAGDTAGITAALAQGADVNAKSERSDHGKPAISDGVIVVRTLGHLYGIGQ